MGTVPHGLPLTERTIAANFVRRSSYLTGPSKEVWFQIYGLEIDMLAVDDEILKMMRQRCWRYHQKRTDHSKPLWNFITLQKSCKFVSQGLLGFVLTMRLFLTAALKV